MSLRSISVIIIFLLIISACNSFKKGNKRFENGEYNDAVGFYETALKKGSYRAASNFQIAEAYRLSNRLNLAAPFYKAAIEQGIKDESAKFYLGYALKANEQYKEAKEQFLSYLENASNFEYIDRAKKEVNNLGKLDQLISKKNYFEIRNMDALNTEAGEYAPVVYNGEIYFTSSRGNGKIYKATGTPFSNLYKAKIEGSRVDVSTIQPLGEDFNTGNINEGSIAFSRDGKTMIFARGNSGRNKGTKEVNLYISYLRRGDWTKPEMMSINDPNAWDSTPVFSADGRTLYFASNREGGFGGIDLYSATMDGNGRWVNVKNMGNEINTSGDELFPHVTDDGRLFFSSNGHPGLGQLDIFVAVRKEGKIEIENLGTPINSANDDFGLSYINPMHGFFSSNRSSSKGDDDIFLLIDNSPERKVVNYFLAGLTYTTNDQGEEEILPNVKIRFVDSSGNLIEEAASDLDGKFNFKVEGGMNYELVGAKQGHFTTREEFTTVGKTVPQEELTKPVTNITFETKLVLDKIVLNKTIVLENIYYDLDKADIRSDAAVEIDKLVALLKDNPNIKIELGSHTDSRADDDYNLRLSQRRAESAVNYIVSEGIDKTRIRAKGYGETQLINRCTNDAACSEEEHQQNRRTEFKVFEYNPDTNRMEELGPNK
ncbi:MAG: OmpA family protein [Bacteroidota bacterium]|nr:OmpA family protein [Bacteroidota bacterium]